MNNENPYGYSQNEQGGYETNQEEAKQIRRLFDTSKRAVIYSRTATSQQQGENSALASQIEACQQFCQEHGYSIEQIYSEVANGKTDYHQRPQLATLLRQATEPKPEFDTVVISSFDRLSRDYVQALSIIDQLNQHLIKVVCVDGQAESDIVGFIQSVRAEISKIEQQMIIERMKRGKAAKKAQREQQ